MSSSKKIHVNDNDTTRIAVLETTAAHIHEELAKIDKRFDKIDQRFDFITQTMLDLRKEASSNFKWLLTLYLGGFGTLLAVIAHGFKWI